GPGAALKMITMGPLETSSRPSDTSDVLEVYFSRIVRFFGRAKYDQFHLAVAGRRGSHRFAYAVAHATAKYRVSAFLISLFLYLWLPGIRRFPNADILLSGDTLNNQRA